MDKTYFKTFLDDLYYKGFERTREQLAALAERDRLLQETKHGPLGLAPHCKAVETIGMLYVDYMFLYNDLCLYYDQSLQTQKRPYVWALIEGVIARLFELKLELQKIEASEYTYIDSGLVERHMIPDDVKIFCPFFYPVELRSEENQYIVDEILSGNRLGDPGPTPSEIMRQEELDREERERLEQEAEEAAKVKKKPFHMYAGDEPKVENVERKPKEIVIPESFVKASLIQSHEKARQGRGLYKDKFFKKQVTLGLKEYPMVYKATMVTQALAVGVIKKVFRGFTEMRKNLKRDSEYKQMMGMVVSFERPMDKYRKLLEEVRQIRRNIRKEYYKKWIEEHVKIDSRILWLKEGKIMEDISDEVREWFLLWYQNLTVFDDYPYPKEGGSILVVTGQTMSIDEYLEWEKNLIYKKKKEKKSKEQLKQEKKERRELKAALKKAAKEKKAKEENAYQMARRNPITDPGHYVYQSSIAELLREGLVKYNRHFKVYDEKDDNSEAVFGFISEIIKEDLYAKRNVELRPAVDEMMRLELRQLVKANKRDHKKKRKKVRKKPKRKKPKKKKNKKKRKKKDPLGNRSTESMFQELADVGIIKSYPKVTMEDYWGDLNYIAAHLRSIPMDPKFPPPCLGDVRQRVLESCVLPLGTEYPKKPRTVALVGPPRSGKTLLVHAVCTEANAVLFDLSAEVLLKTSEQYPGKKGLTKLLMIIMRVATTVSPSIIFIKRAERLFYKKVPMGEKILDPKRLGPLMKKKVIKMITPKVKIVVIGALTYPLLSRPRKFKKIFPIGILVPRTDYGSAFLIILQILSQYFQVDHNLDVHSLAKCLTGASVGLIRAGIDSIFTPERIMLLGVKPLTAEEIFESLCRRDDFNVMKPEEFDKYLRWYSKFTFVSKDVKAMNELLGHRRKFMEKENMKKTKKKPA